MTNLHLDPEILISGLRGESRRDIRTLLGSVADTIRARAQRLAEQRERAWTSSTSILVIAPSSQILQDGRSADVVEDIVRMCRVTGVVVRLIDVLPPLANHTEAKPSWPIAAFGHNESIRAFAHDPAMTAVTYHLVTPTELSDMLENLNTTGPQPVTPPALDYSADQHRAQAIEQILRNAGEPLTMVDIVDRLDRGGALFPADDNGRYNAAFKALETLIDAGRAERWMERLGHTYQAIASYEPARDDDSDGIRAAIRTVLLRVPAGTAPALHRVDLAADVSSYLGQKGFFPDNTLIENHIVALAQEGFLGEPRPGYYVATLAGRRYYADQDGVITTEPDVQRTPTQAATQTRVTEAILRALVDVREPIGSAAIVERVHALGDQEEWAVADSTIRSGLRWLLHAAHVERVGICNYRIADAIRKELGLTDGLKRRRDRMDAVRGEVLHTIAHQPGMTLDEVRDAGSFYGNGAEAVAELLNLLAAGEVVGRDRRVYTKNAAEAIAGGAA